MSARRSSSEKLSPLAATKSSGRRAAPGAVPLEASVFANAELAGVSAKAPVISSARSRGSAKTEVAQVAAEVATADRVAALPPNAVAASAETREVINSLSLRKPTIIPSPPRARAVPSAVAILTAEEKIMAAGAVPLSIVVVSPRQNQGEAAAVYMEASIPSATPSRALVLLDDESMVGHAMQAKAMTVAGAEPVVIENVKATVHPITAQKIDMLAKMPNSVIGLGRLTAGSHLHTVRRGGASPFIAAPVGQHEEVLMTVTQKGAADKIATLEDIEPRSGVLGIIRETLPIVSLSALSASPAKTIAHVEAANKMIAATSASLISAKMGELVKESVAISSASARLGNSTSAKLAGLSRSFQACLADTARKIDASLAQLTEYELKYARLAATTGLTDIDAMNASRVAANLQKYTEIRNHDLPVLAEEFARKMDATVKGAEETLAKALEAHTQQPLADLALIDETLSKINKVANIDVTSTI